MKIAIVGSGACGLYCAILLKKKNPGNDIYVIEKDSKIGRKLYATGNGHCNLLNKSLSPEAFNHPDFLAKAISLYPYDYLKQTLQDLGVEVLEDGDYVYPLSYSASSFVDFLVRICQSLGVHFFLNTKVSDYVVSKKAITLVTDGKPLPSFEKLIVAVGGASTPKLGSDGSFYPILIKHGYRLSAPRPGLAPLRLDDVDISPLAGIRHDAKVEAVCKGKTVFSQLGEILYKEDGISGIVVFNAESALQRHNAISGAKLKVDLFPNLSEETLFQMLSKDKKSNPSFFLKAYFQDPLIAHICHRAKTETDIEKIAKTTKNLEYIVRDSYSFESSQVTIGGLDLSEVSDSLQSQRENGVFFGGEIVDIDGECGGFNLSWALLSALLIEREL